MLDKDDGRSLEEHGVKEESTLHLAVTWPIDIFVRGPRGAVLYLRDLELSDTVWTVKEKISDKDGVPPALLRVVYGGKQLEDGSTLADCNVRNHTTVHAVLRLGGRCLIIADERASRKETTWYCE
ncbi:ubiquitin-like [Brachypodium distachyon]|uniref:ubiquitin-like n=1 Tax=Brachypodium distachyon TaxID=15368 RepID=UPI00052FE00D|nr:ubiquitin-like [Brachypodium distachyon]|eukprot:XP_003561099.2 ubiquitin-like [Brachypodium distachyon]